MSVIAGMSSDQDINLVIKNTVSQLRAAIKLHGKEVKPRDILTKELVRLDLNMTVKQADIIEMSSIDPEESDQYNFMYNALFDASKKFEDDRDTRQAVFVSSEWCPSLIHLMIREDILLVTATYRSVDIDKLGSDLKFLANTTKDLLTHLKLKNGHVKMSIISLHDYKKSDDDGRTDVEIL